MRSVRVSFTPLPLERRRGESSMVWPIGTLANLRGNVENHLRSSKTSGMIPEMNPNPDHSYSRYGQLRSPARRLPGYDIENVRVAWASAPTATGNYNTIADIQAGQFWYFYKEHGTSIVRLHNIEFYDWALGGSLAETDKYVLNPFTGHSFMDDVRAAQDNKPVEQYYYGWDRTYSNRLQYDSRETRQIEVQYDGFIQETVWNGPWDLRGGWYCEREGIDTSIPQVNNLSRAIEPGVLRVGARVAGGAGNNFVYINEYRSFWKANEGMWLPGDVLPDGQGAQSSSYTIGLGEAIVSLVGDLIGIHNARDIMEKSNYRCTWVIEYVSFSASLNSKKYGGAIVDFGSFDCSEYPNDPLLVKGDLAGLGQEITEDYLYQQAKSNFSHGPTTVLDAYKKKKFSEDLSAEELTKAASNALFSEAVSWKCGNCKNISMEQFIEAGFKMDIKVVYKVVKSTRKLAEKPIFIPQHCLDYTSSFTVTYDVTGELGSSSGYSQTGSVSNGVTSSSKPVGRHVTKEGAEYKEYDGTGNGDARTIEGGKEVEYAL